MQKIKDIFQDDDWITVELFWKTVDSIQDDSTDWSKHKNNIRALYKKDGTPKARALAPKTPEDFQTIHDTTVFIRKMLRHKIHMDRRKKRREMMLDNIKDVKAGKDVPRRITQDLKIEEPRKEKMQRRRAKRKEQENDQV